MDQFDFATSQGVGISNEIAGIGSRIGAYIIDSVVIGVIILGISLLFGSLFDSENFILIVFLLCPLLFYSLLMEFFFHGQSLGKMAMSIRVISEDGHRLSAGQCFSRWIFRILEIHTASGAVAILAAGINKKNKRFGDMVAGTLVINDKMQAGEIFKMPEFKTDYLPYHQEAALMTDLQANILQRVVNLTSDSPQRHQIHLRMKQQIKKVFNIDQETLAKPDFLEEFLQDYYFYCWKIAYDQNQALN
ncbi:RDD family protein [Persicobacter diffluens]|uniref:RDD domain-containing protein n=1 Tax=Persicobacter diffluens TaxID=981 RepID=A0AAN4VZX4_9BACT|nr:hypothetical protein PEDI_24420 [Persicobacter diffluens]